MATFNDTRSQTRQEHFTIVEIDLPVVEGTCTLSGEPGFGTPLTCDESTTGTFTYKFTEVDAPLLKESGIQRLITSVSEITPTLKSGNGLASRGTATIRFTDKKGDPNPFAPAVTTEVRDNGSYMAKFAARNVFENKECRIKNYRVESDGTIDLANGAEVRYYIIESLDYNKNGSWSLKLKDELSKVEVDESLWPVPLSGVLNTNINDTTTSFLVDQEVIYKVDDVIRIGDELMRIATVTDIGTPSAQVSVNPRGGDIIGSTTTLSTTTADSHSAGDEIFVCEVSDNERIDDLLERILLDVGVDASFIPKSDWTDEIDEWWPNTFINTVWVEAQDTSEVLNLILKNYMIDMWFDPVAREIKIAAISAWKQSVVKLTEGSEINADSVNKKAKEQIRATRAYVVYDKPNKVNSDDVENYRKGSLYKRTELETSDFYGKPKSIGLGFSPVIDTDTANLLVNRYVNRFTNPFEYSFETEESKLSFDVGDVVDAETLADVGFDGSLKTTRFQITSIQPSYGKVGRNYKIKGLSYEPLFTTGSEIIVSGNTTDINLYTQYAGAPSEAVTLTFVFDGATCGGSSTTTASVRAGDFPAGSKLIIILANGAFISGKGGRGGNGADLFVKPTDETINSTGIPTDGEDGGISFDAMGIDCDIYFSGSTPSATFPTADGYIFAPSGGSGGFNAELPDEKAGDGGDGGNGVNPGLGGDGGDGSGSATDGLDGEAGNSDRVSGNFGIDGDPNNANAGLAGKGVIDSGATVAFFGSTASRYINGNGDH